MNWTIKNDCFVAAYNGHRFELGEMGRNKWTLRHWSNEGFKDWQGKPASDWYNVASEQEGKAMAERIARTQ
jgi:hypothetical protein